MIRDWSVGRSNGPRTEMNNLDQKTFFTHAAVGRVVDACLHNDDRTRRWKPHRWSVSDGNVGMYRERTSTVKLAGGFTHVYLKDMSRRASWPDFAGACTGSSGREGPRVGALTLKRAQSGVNFGV